MNWLDVVILLILIAFIAYGCYKGLIFSVISLFSNFINFVIALFLTRPMTNLFNKMFGLEGALTKGFASKISSMGAGFNQNLVGMSSAEIKSHVSTTLTEADFPFKNLFKSMLRMDGDAIASKGSLTLTDILSKSFGSFFALVICFVITFALIWGVLFFVGWLSKKFHQVDSIRVIDRVLGSLFGLVKGCLAVCFIFAILSFFNENGVMAPFFDYLKSSALGNFMYSNVNYLVDKYLNFKTVVNAIKSFV